MFEIHLLNYYLVNILFLFIQLPGVLGLPGVRVGVRGWDLPEQPLGFSPQAGESV